MKIRIKRRKLDIDVGIKRLHDDLKVTVAKLMLLLAGINKIPTEMGDNGNEFVVFNDELLELGCEKWKSTICGYFMNGGDESLDIQEKYDIQNNSPLKGYNDEGLHFLKFHDEVGLSLKGISVHASNLRKPIIMDDMTTKMCLKGEGRTGFARVLVELDAREIIKDKIDVMYKGKKRCKLNKKDKIEERIVNGNETVDIVFKVVQIESKVEYRKKNEEGKEKVSVKEQVDKETNQEKCNKNGNIEFEKNNNGKGLRSYNRFTLLGSLVNEEELVPSIEQIKVVDEILRRKIDASDGDMNGWNVKMKRYYKDRKELFNVALELERDEDIIDGHFEAEEYVIRNEVNGMDRNILVKDLVLFPYMDVKIDVWNIRGLSTMNKQKEVRNLIKEESMQLCAIIETHIKFHKIKKVREKIFGNWEYISNGEDSNKGCMIMVGWNSIVYASNSLIDRRKLCKELVGDILSAGFHFTWTKSLRNQNCRTLKKLDKIMINEAFLDKFPQESLQILQFYNKEKGVLPTVKEEWKKDIERYMIVVSSNKLTNKEAIDMVKPVSENEVKNAMFDIEDSKERGPDGFTARFYKSAWSIVGKEVCKAIQGLFETGKLLGEVNATLISIVPKIQTRDKVFDFRPIACCNVLYKCISKIMTNRLKKVLGKLVNENQSAFITGRQITDNILLSQELFRGYNRKQKTKKVSIKIDLQKAYDTISLESLKISLEQCCFHHKMVE
ncbi:RNA-directed DNA polymerase, eukaryota, reverse transcriptase zinc-binding domain protein [Tanacetum coccineum]